MPLIPCLKHEGSYILYIKLDQDKTEFICEQCHFQLYDKNLNLNLQEVIHIKSAFKQPYLLLSNLNQISYLKQTLYEFDKFNENHINSILNDLNAKICNIQNTLQIVKEELEYYAQQFLNMKQKLKNELEKIIKFDQFQQIIANLENLGDSINPQVIGQNEKNLHQYLQDLKQIDHVELYLTLIAKVQGLRIEFKDLDRQQYPECEKLQEQFKSFNTSQIEFIKQIRLITFEQFFTQLLSDKFQYKIINIIQSKINKKIISYQQIYFSTRDGLNGQAFWNKVNQKSNLLMIFKSKSGNIFGAFSSCQWVCVGGSYVQDGTLSSFIFSQTHDQIYPIKEGYKQNAIYCHQSYGPTFGGGHDINISTDFQGGYSSLGHSYQCDQYQISNKNTHLFGQTTPNIAECEIFMLTFV